MGKAVRNSLHTAFFCFRGCVRIPSTQNGFDGLFGPFAGIVAAGDAPGCVPSSSLASKKGTPDGLLPSGVPPLKHKLGLLTA